MVQDVHDSVHDRWLRVGHVAAEWWCVMKCSDIPDERVIELARAWQNGSIGTPGVVTALELDGVPPKVAVAKVKRLVNRGILDYGVSINYAWPV